jgi:mediator of RNA polymerase II transcription subunit 23
MLSNERELIEHFSMQNTPSLFLCIIWKMLIESDRINPLAFKVIEQIGPKGLSNHLRKFCDFIVFEFANAGRLFKCRIVKILKLSYGADLSQECLR